MWTNPCLLGLLATALTFAGGTHLLEEGRDGGVGLAGGVVGDLDRLALGGRGGFASFAHGRFGVGLGERLADATLFFGRETRDRPATIGAGLTDVATGAVAFGLAGAAFATGLIGLTFGPARLLAARLDLRRAVRLVRLTAFHGLLDLLEYRGDFGVGLACGIIGEFPGLLLGFLSGLLSLGGLLVGLLHRRVLLGLLHGLVEALLFVGVKLDRQAG
jgi:hypothetical protein